MARGKYLSLEEARKAKKLDRFAEEHPTKGSKKEFDALLLRIVDLHSRLTLRLQIRIDPSIDQQLAHYQQLVSLSAVQNSMKIIACLGPDFDANQHAIPLLSHAPRFGSLP